MLLLVYVALGSTTAVVLGSTTAVALGSTTPFAAAPDCAKNNSMSSDACKNFNRQKLSPEFQQKVIILKEYTGCSLNIVFFSKILQYIPDTGAAAELAEFRKITTFKRKTQYLMKTLYLILRCSEMF